VSRLGQDPNADAIIRAVVGMTEALGVRANAEGVETRTQAEALRAQGCTEAQGFLYSRPVSGNAFDALLREGAKEQGETRKTDPAASPEQAVAS